jgi:hypothetical protein
MYLVELPPLYFFWLSTLNWHWLNVAAIFLNEAEQQELQRLRLRLWNHRTLLMNEATIWARGIYPLLSLAEQGNIQAWAIG